MTGNGRGKEEAEKSRITINLVKFFNILNVRGVKGTVSG